MKSSVKYSVNGINKKIGIYALLPVSEFAFAT